MKKTSAKNGFTLLEIIVAIALIGFSLVGMMYVFSTSMMNSNRGKNHAIALNLAREKIEEYSTWPLPSSTGEARAALPSPYDDFDREVVVTNYTGYSAADLQQVTVTIYWGNKSISLETLVGG